MVIHNGFTVLATFVGNENQKVEPFPGVDSTPIWPPCVSIILLQIAKPSPVDFSPAVGRVLIFVWPKLLKRWGISSGFMPGP